MFCGPPNHSNPSDNPKKWWFSKRNPFKMRGSCWETMISLLTYINYVYIYTYLPKLIFDACCTTFSFIVNKLIQLLVETCICGFTRLTPKTLGTRTLDVGGLWGAVSVSMQCVVVRWENRKNMKLWDNLMYIDLNETRTWQEFGFGFLQKECIFTESTMLEVLCF